MILYLRLLDWSHVTNQNMTQSNDTAKLGKADTADVPVGKCDEDKADYRATVF